MSPFTFSPLPARLFGAARAMRGQAHSAVAASRRRGIDARQAAMLRGKAQAYDEAALLMEALLAGRKSTKLRRKRADA